DASGAPQSSEGNFHAVIELALHVMLAAVEELGHAVVVVEDLHWVDPSSRALVTRLVSAAETRSLLVILTERPDVAGGHTTLAGVAEVLSIEPLANDQMRHLVASVATKDVQKGLVDMIVRRAEGIPLFAEELARTAGQRSA